MLRKVRSLPSHALPLPNPTCWISLYHLTPSLMIQLISLFLFIMYQPLCTFHILLDPWKENLKVNLPKKTSKDTYQEPVGYSTQFHCFSIHIRSAMGLPCFPVPKHILVTALEGEQGALAGWAQEGSSSHTHAPRTCPRQGWWSSAHPRPSAWGSVTAHTIKELWSFHFSRDQC